MISTTHMFAWETLHLTLMISKLGETSRIGSNAYTCLMFILFNNNKHWWYICLEEIYKNATKIQTMWICKDEYMFGALGWEMVEFAIYAPRVRYSITPPNTMLLWKTPRNYCLVLIRGFGRSSPVRNHAQNHYNMVRLSTCQAHTGTHV